MSAEKRVILSMGGKGGVGKTSVMAALAEWLDVNEIAVELLDLDTENKARGSLAHFFGGRPKVNIHTPAGLDTFVDRIADGAPVILADMGAGSGQVTYDWFDKMYPDVAGMGIVFTAIGVITPDPASVESVLTWASRLQNRVRYLIVENCVTEQADFIYWRDSEQAQQFQKGLPQVGQTFLAMNGDFQKGLTAFDRTAHDLKSGHRDSSDQIRAACTQLVQFVHGLVETVIAERGRLSRKYQWLQYSVACIVLIIVFALGRRYERWKNPPAQPSENIAAPFAEQPAPPAAVPKAPRRAR